METYRSSDGDLAAKISGMSESEICRFIRQESKFGRLSSTVRDLNRDALSTDDERRSRAETAIRRLGFI